MYAVLDIFFLVFHASLISFILTGWIWTSTRRLHLLVMGLTCFSLVRIGADLWGIGGVSAIAHRLIGTGGEEGARRNRTSQFIREVLHRPSHWIELGPASCRRNRIIHRTGGTRPFHQPELAGLAQVRQ